MSKMITRSTVNENQYNAPEFPKSGFNLSYRDYNDYMLGRWHVSGYQWAMPSDKISGHNKGNFTFNRIVTPMVAPVHVGQYNVYCTLRSIDNTFQENVAPSKHNGYSAEWRMPMTNTRAIVTTLLDSYFPFTTWEGPGEENVRTLSSFLGLLVSYVKDAYENDVTPLISRVWPTQVSFNAEYATGGIFRSIIDAFTDPTSTVYKDAAKMYAVDVLKDLQDFLISRIGNTAPLITERLDTFLYNLLDGILTPWVGRYSYYCDFGYNFLRPSDLFRISQGQYVGTGYADFLSLIDDTPLNEYPLRAMYAFWYDRCRDVNLQPVSSTLPNPRKFGSTSILDTSAGGNLIYLLYRIRRWTEDMFISAQCDSPARHVFAPIYQSYGDVEMMDNDVENLYAQSNLSDSTPGAPKIASQRLEFLDPITGTSRSVVCPVPSFVNDVLSRASLTDFEVYGLGLQNLRQAQNMERYLKRLDYFGDEYNDYMLAQYNSRVSDLRINHPEILSQSFDDANYEQEIANMSNEVMEAGTRTATGTLSSGGDGYTTFTEEFGIIINVISFMPEASYDNACPQLLMSRLVDLPLPIFAANNDELGRIMEIAANGLSPALNGDDADFRFMFGHYPAYHAWRSRVDRVRGSFLNEHQDCLFRRFYGMTDGITTPRLNYEFINCRPNLQMFANTVRYDCQLYGDVVHECFVERVLPTPVETI